MRGRSRRGLFSRRGGEISIFDIVLLVPLLVVALLFLDTVVTLPTGSVSSTVNASRYASEGLDSVLTATAPNARIYTYGLCGFFYYCWYPTDDADDSIHDLILIDVYLVSCGVTTQRQLDQPGWVGAVINQTAESVAEGAYPAAPSTTFGQYYINYNGTATNAFFGCQGRPTPVYVHEGYQPVFFATNVYTSDIVLNPDPVFPGEGAVQVVMGFWQP